MTTRRSLFSLLAGAVTAVMLPKALRAKPMWSPYWPGSHGAATAYIIDSPNAAFFIPDKAQAAAGARCILLPGLFDYRSGNPLIPDMDMIISGDGDLDVLVAIPGCSAVVRHRLFTCDEIAENAYSGAEMAARLEKLGPYRPVLTAPLSHPLL